MGNTMRHLITSSLAAGLLLAATPTFADQVPNDHTATNKAHHKAEMKECMEKMQAKDKDKTMSHEKMKKACHEQLNGGKHDEAHN